MSQSTATGKMVLVIDDDADFCASMRELLVGSGYVVETTTSVKHALELLTDPKFQPSAIIVDIRMPEMDGYAFLAASEFEPRLSNIPVLVVSAYGDPTGIERDFISKPVNVSRLLRSLSKVTEAQAHALA